MATDRKTFIKSVTVLCDTAEQKNGHIKSVFDGMGIKYRDANLILGDYSFEAQGRDFSLSCVIERKNGVDELYQNLTRDRERIEREFSAAKANINDFSLLLEGVGSIEEVESFCLPDWQLSAQKRQVSEIGTVVAASIHSWSCENKYGFKLIFAKSPEESAIKILNKFYYYWRNFKLQNANRRNMKRGEQK